MQETETAQSELGKDGKPTLTKVGKRNIALSRLKRKILKHVWLLRVLLVAGIFIGFYIVFLLLGGLVRKTGADFYLGLVKDFVFTPQPKVKSLNGNTNILILGKGGEGHEAPDLTDTMIFASISHSDPEVTLISLPRDLWITDLRAKLNSTYYWGNKKEPGGGIILTKATVEEIVGQPIHYGVIIDFSGFKRIVEVLGGIEVGVERTFTDNKYPIAGRENDLCGGDPEYKCRYETIEFKKGLQHMDGETALKFVRSRNAEVDEGTDFARAARQQKVLSAIKNKVLSREILFSPKKLLALKNEVLKSVETDITPEAGTILFRRTLQARNSVNSHVFPEGLLINPPKSPKYDNLYVFIPKDESWGEIHEWIECVLRKINCK